MAGSFSFKMVFLPVRNLSTQKADRNWEMIVASAAPLTPMPNTKINSGSRTIFATAPRSTVYMPMRPNPWEFIKLFMPSPIITNTLPSR